MLFLYHALGAFFVFFGFILCFLGIDKRQQEIPTLKEKGTIQIIIGGFMLVIGVVLYIFK